MKINFNINFHTVWGQVVYITGSILELGAWNSFKARAMQHTGEGNWSLDIELPDETISFEYRYFLLSNGQYIFEEWQRNHQLEIKDVNRNYILVDYWLNRPNNMAEYSSAFINSWFAHPCDKFERVVKSSRKLIIKVLAPEISKEHSLAITGNQEKLGNWDISKALIMSCDNFPEWSAEIDSTLFSFPVEYKLCILNNEDRSLFEWEKGNNRTLYIPSIGNNETLIISGLQYRPENTIKWKFAGTVIPVFSLRSNESYGIGDFGDLKKMIDWMESTSQKILQILPVNDTTSSHTWRDSYPYNAISMYALHPLYLNLPMMGKLHDMEMQKFYDEKRDEINQLPELDYEKTEQLKWSFFRDLYAQEGNSVLQSPEFNAFFQTNKEWLIPYASYSYLRDFYKTPDFHFWGEYSSYNEKAIEKLCSSDSPQYFEIALYYYLQFHLHTQLTEVKNYAHSKKVVLKGDIPIGISRLSIETWSEPNYFNMKYQTGAPPDDFSEEGQNWKFPTYNWDVMEKDNYNWWKKRFLKMADYFDAYRIDHILGFFRIWEIPDTSIQGLLGWFSPSMPFSINEIENSGFYFDKKRYTQARIREDFLPEIFGEYTGEVKQTFLDRITATHFALKEKFDTQAKIQKYLEIDEAKSNIIRSGLFSICNEVLFLEDKHQSDFFHPRILANHSYAYKELSHSDQYAFDFLYWNYFYQRNNSFWKESGYKKLSSIFSTTNMLACGEDLGMILHAVPEVMQKLQILSLEIERMPKESDVEFTSLEQLPYLSVCSTSTHDMSPIRAWWKEDRQKIQRYYNNVLKREGKAPEECSAEICRQIISNHLNTNSMLVIIPWQDWLSVNDKLRHSNSMGERINYPAISRHYWRYRMHISIENLLCEDKYNRELAGLIKESGR